MKQLGQTVLGRAGGEAEGYGTKGKKKEKGKLIMSYNSLIISPLFFDAFTGELIRLITSVNYRCSPPPHLY